MVSLYREAIAAGASPKRAAEVIGTHQRTLERWNRDGIRDDLRKGPRTRPAHSFSPEEKVAILGILNSPKYRDLSPRQIVPQLADKENLYIASESAMYRILRENNQLHHRQPSAPPQSRTRPRELIADAPNQVWSWDITLLRTEIKGSFYYLYLVMDVWSRKIVGWEVNDTECTELSTPFIEGTCFAERINANQLVLHSDNGSPMKGSTLIEKMRSLGVANSFSRPGVSNDNPYIESLFRVVKYRPNYPRKPFKSIDEARSWVCGFVEWYNTEHLHSGIRFVSPSTRHKMRENEILRNRKKIYAEAKKRNPSRWTRGTRNWSPIKEVTLNPGMARRPL